MDSATPSPSVPPRLAAALAGRYRLERELGAGGMATVYLAEDVKHSRKVAVKVLKPELAAVLGAERFLTEIKTTANLQHPHILPLFDSGEADTYLYYVMPFVEGESLRDRLDRERQLGVDDAVRIARDVADALDYAHRHGVIHRDIKPANILLHDGRPLVADFGIALAISAAGGGRMTETGLSLGTPHYMSPEQASAERDLSARSDVYSLGCVLYEMLAGEPPHTGPNAASILMRILTEQPRAISDLRATVPAHVAGAITKAVEKLPADRFETARQFRDALDDPSFRFTRTTAAAVAPATHHASPSVTVRGWDTRSKVLAATTTALAATSIWLALPDRSEVEAPADIISFQLADSIPGDMLPAAGPNGWLAHVSGRRLYVRPPGSVQAVALAGAEGLSDDFVSFSTNGEWIAFAQASGDGSILRKSPTRGGNPVTVASVKGSILSPHWGSDGWIYFTAGTVGTWASVRVPENGGALDTLVATGLTIPYHYTKLPGRGLLMSLFSGNVTDPRVVAVDVEKRDTLTLVSGGYAPEWSPTGHLLYARNEGSLFAIPFDAASLRVTGSPVPVLDSLGETYPVARYDLSASGTLIYVAGRTSGGGAGASYTLRLDDLDGGGQQKIPLPPSDHWDAKFSPDGRRLAYIRNDHVWVYDLDLGTHTQLTREGSRHHNPVWSPDGARVVFSAATPGRSDVDLYVAGAKGQSLPERFAGSAADDYASQWLPDSTVLVHTQGSNENILLARSGAEPTPVLQADWQERNGRVSPDGRWLAYVSRENRRAALYVRRWPSLSSRVQVSVGDANLANSSSPLWSNDGRTLFYHQGLQIIGASVDGSRDSLRITSRKVIEEGVRGILADLHPDGRRFLVLALDTPATDSAAAQAPRRLVVATNWIVSLRERLGR